MRHNKDGRKLNRTTSHRRALMRNMVTSLFAAERIETTTAKAKEARRVAERMITFARRGDLAARRHVAKTVQNPKILQKLFDEIAPRYTDRPGGYTRVLKLGVGRKGDNAERAILELVGEKDEGRKKKKKPRKTYHKVDIPKSPERAPKTKKDTAQEGAVAEEIPAAEPEAPEGGAAPEEKPQAEKEPEAMEEKPASDEKPEEEPEAEKEK
jgi:large subunit ribosomal protein L17